MLFLLMFCSSNVFIAAGEMANNVDPDQTAPMNRLTWVCTVSSGLLVAIFRRFTVIKTYIVTMENEL